MNRYHELGLQLVGNTIDSPEILEILKCRHYGYEPAYARQDQKLFREGIPLLARVLYVCDVFDSMVNDRAFKKRLLVPEALVELLKCSPGQFDPEIVRCLVKHVEEHGYEPPAAGDLRAIDPRSALNIGSQIEVVYQALDTRNLDSLRETSRALRTQATKVFAHDLVDATIDLEEAINNDLPDEQLHQIAGELMELCRETRLALISPTGATNP